MKSMRAAAEDLVKRHKQSTSSAFCSDIVQIEFNAWHYVDTNLWASLVSYILERLADHVSPAPTAEEKRASFLSELGSAQTMVKEAETEKERAQKQIGERQDELQRLQKERQQKEVTLLDLRASDLTKLLSDQDKKSLEQSLDQLGVPAALNSISDLTQVVSEIYTVRGRLAALFHSLLNGKNRVVLAVLLLVVVGVIPLGAYVLQQLVENGLIAGGTALIAELVAVITGATTVLRKALGQVKTHVEKVEASKRRIDELLIEKRKNPDPQEITLQGQIAALSAKEQEATSRLSAAAARVLDLEERIRSLKEEGSLARFLAERTHSDDYRKHLGLISTIRRDFEALDGRLASARSSADRALRPVDRIILYIDDLDRCPADRVMEVLQAVHLLLAYPLFVVVVGVDPRWLLHSLGKTYPAFNGDHAGPDANPDRWRTTPQNYLEKIFQIPFSLRPMTAQGYGRLMGALLPSQVELSNASMPQDGMRQPDAPKAPTLTPPSPKNTQPDPGGTVKGPEDVPASTIAPDASPDDKDEKPSFVIHEESLLLKPWEAKFAEDLFSLMPTPRAAKRFSNVYRILKAPVARERLSSFEGTAELPGDFRVPMVLLAGLIGSPDEAAVLFPKLQQSAVEGRHVLEVLKDFTTSRSSSPGVATLCEKLLPLVAQPGFPHAPELFGEWIPRVSRFSFELGRLTPSSTLDA
jgi:hypothetical protein